MFRFDLKRAGVALAVVTMATVAACGSENGATSTSSSAQQSTETPASTLEVVTTIYPVTYFAERIGGDRVEVESLIKPGVDAHDFEPTPGDILTIGSADVLVYTHPVFETWIDDAIQTAGSDSLVVVQSVNVDLEEHDDHGDDDKDEHGHEDDDDHGHGDDDEHGHDEDEHGHDDKDEEAKLVSNIAHVIEEVEDGEITADAGIEEIEELLGGHAHDGDAMSEQDDDEHGHDEHLEELKAEILEKVKMAEDGSIGAEEAIHEIEEIVGGHMHADEDDDHDHSHDDHGHGDEAKDEDDHAHDEDGDHAHGDDDEHGHDEHGHDHDHGGADPHVWLNPVEATEQVRAIQAAFQAADSAGADVYKANADALVADLLELDREFGAALDSCTLDHIVVSHEAYGHLAERYDLEQLGLADLSAEFDSTPGRIAEIIDEIRELGVNHILQEPILSDDLTETVAAETGTEILPLHPLESLTPAEVDAGDDYFIVMRRNLESLKTALGCS